MAYQQNAEIPMGIICVPLSGFVFFFCYEMDFMSKLHKFKQHDLIDMFNDILTIYSPSITLNSRNMFLIYIQRNVSLSKQINAEDKETFFI